MRSWTERTISAGFRNSKDTYRHTLERVLLYCDLALAPEYAPMRAYLRERTPALDANEMLIKQARAARWHAIDVKYRNNVLSLLERWENFARMHPRIVALLRDADRTQPLSVRVKSFLSSWIKQHSSLSISRDSK